MAFKMTCEAADGSVREDAYWVPVQVNLAGIEKSGQVVFYAYTSAVAMDEGKAPIAGATKTYSFTKDQFEETQLTKLSELFPDGISGNNIVYEVIARSAYSLARKRKDVPVFGEDGKQLKDEEGNLVFESFFENAENV